MSEGKGYPVIVKLNAAPVKQFASGNSVIFQGDTPEEVATLIAKSIPGGNDDNGALIMAYLAELALAQAVGAALKGGNVVADAVGPPAAGADQPPSASAPASTKGGARGAGAAKTTTAAPTVDPNAPASLALRKVAAKKVGKTADELPSGLTTAEAKALIKG